MDSVDSKISLIRSEINQPPHQPAFTPNVIFGGQDLARVEEKINQLNESISGHGDKLKPF